MPAKNPNSAADIDGRDRDSQWPAAASSSSRLRLNQGGTAAHKTLNTALLQDGLNLTTKTTMAAADRGASAGLHSPLKHRDDDDDAGRRSSVFSSYPADHDAATATLPADWYQWPVMLAILPPLLTMYYGGNVEQWSEGFLLAIVGGYLYGLVKGLRACTAMNSRLFAHFLFQYSALGAVQVHAAPEMVAQAGVLAGVFVAARRRAVPAQRDPAAPENVQPLGGCVPGGAVRADGIYPAADAPVPVDEAPGAAVRSGLRAVRGADARW